MPKRRCPVCNHCGNCIKRKVVIANYKHIAIKEKVKCDVCASPLDTLYD